MRLRRRIFRYKRRLHISIGIVFALYFMLLAFTGVMINHADDWGLTERYVSRRYLPSNYRPRDNDATRLDIVVTDLHSGRIFGRYGHWLPDVVTAFWVVSILSGVGMLVYRRVWLVPKAAPPPARTAKDVPQPATVEPSLRQPVTAEIEPQ